MHVDRRTVRVELPDRLLGVEASIAHFIGGLHTRSLQISWRDGDDKGRAKGLNTHSLDLRGRQLVIAIRIKLVEILRWGGYGFRGDSKLLLEDSDWGWCSCLVAQRSLGKLVRLVLRGLCAELVAQSLETAVD